MNDLHGLLYGSCNVLIYYAVMVVIVLTLRMCVRIYDELFRKILHFVLLGSLAVWLWSFSAWWQTVLTVIVFVIFVYPILLFFERFRTYSAVTTERKHGELKQSLVLVFVMFATVVTVTVGYYGDRWLALASVYAWGIGDAFAALIGKRIGTHKITGKFLSGKKSYEGSAAMFLTSFCTVLLILLLRGGGAVPMLLLISAAAALVSALTELYTPDGLDTVTCPLAAMVTLILLLSVSGGLT